MSIIKGKKGFLGLSLSGKSDADIRDLYQRLERMFYFYKTKNPEIKPRDDELSITATLTSYNIQVQMGVHDDYTQSTFSDETYFHMEIDSSKGKIFIYINCTITGSTFKGYYDRDDNPEIFINNENQIQIDGNKRVGAYGIEGLRILIQRA